ncbi:hypothetical protein ScPMuIL_008451 [Solemya velum]
MTMTQMKQEVLNELNAITEDLLEPFAGLWGLADKFMEFYEVVFGLVKDIKDAYNQIKEGYQFARSKIDQIFGPKCHKLFPRKTRLEGGGCNGKGFFPAKLDSGDPEYADEGVDILIMEGKNVVAPFAGVINRTNNDNEVVLETNGGSLKNIVVTLNNVIPDDTILHPNDDLYTDLRVAAGDVVGKAARSPCGGNNHIHMSLKRGEEFIDPTRFLESRLPQMPVWIQECDDYSLVYQYETVAVGKIVGLDGRKASDTSPKVENSDVEQPEAVDATRKLGEEVQEMKEDAGSLFSKIKSKQLPEDFDDESDNTHGGSGSDGGSSGTTETKKKKNGLGSLMSKPKNFLQKFSIWGLKLGSIVDFMDFLGLNESKVKMTNVMKTVKRIVDNKPCYNPCQMTDETLRTTLKERGKKASGTTDQMINRLFETDNQCPLLSFTMPKNMYCTFDSMCLGVECCINMKIFMFLKTFKAYVRFDPCDLEFHIGFHTWKKTISLGSSYNGFEDKIATGITLDLLGGVELILRYSIEKTDMETVATFQAGFCNIDDKTNCLPFLYIVDEAVFPLPICYPNGSMGWPDVNFAEYFSKENVARRLKETGKKVMKEAGKLALTEILEELGLPEDILDPTPPCPRPDKMTVPALQAAMEERGLLMTGGRSDWETRYRQDDLTCTVLGKTVVLPDMTNAKLWKHLYYYIADDCLRIDSCVDFTIARLDYTKALRAYIDLDPCQLMLTVAFEKWSKTFLLINYDWGAEKVVPVNDNTEIRFALDRDVDLKIYEVDFWLKLCLSGSECVVDAQLFSKQEIPMPVCNENFTMPG